jgi:anti-sigma regulatory factor (Ser/Thr protein kinase)
VPRLATRVELLADDQAPAQARGVVREVLAAWGLPTGVVDDTVLAVSELVTNAVLHARSASTLELELGQTRDWLRFSVADACVVPPLAQLAGGADESGRGMAILAALSDRWGIEPHARGKRVWCEVDLVFALATSVRPPADVPLPVPRTRATTAARRRAARPAPGAARGR